MADTNDTGFELLPPDAGELTPDEALDAALGNQTLERDPDLEPVPFGRGWDFDFRKGQFRRHGSGPAPTSDLTTLRVWIEKTLRTARFAHPIYSDQYGTDMPEGMIVGRPFSPELAGSYVSALVDALLVHDRIQRVTNVRFTGDPADDLLEVSFTVVIDDDDELFLDEIPVGVPS